MDTQKKLEILSEDSQYDLACACGSNKDDRRHRGSDGRWLYPVPLPQGGYSVLLKTLLSNVCSNDCKYCPLRNNSNVRRCSMSPEETAKIFMQYLKKTEVFGLFLSSGVIDTPDKTMDKLNAVAAILRKKYKFKGYIHLKIIPGASDAAIEESISLASAVSLNIETPGEKYFRKLSLKKDYNKDIIQPLKLMSKLTTEDRKYPRVKCTSQFIVGASDEKDSEIIHYMSGMYDRLKFERVYFSAYQPGLGDSSIPGENNFSLEPEEVLTREHRLYQVDFLLRKYGFKENEIIFNRYGNLDLSRDPKEIWALNHPDIYPVNVNKADKETLLRVPGMGPLTVNRLLKFRKLASIDIFKLVELNFKGKRLEKALPFMKFN